MINIRLLVSAVCFIAIGVSASAQQIDQPQARPPAVKPAATVLKAHHRTDLIQVKFLDDSGLRVKAGRLTDDGNGVLDARTTAALAELNEGRWEARYSLPRWKLKQMRAKAQRNLNRQIADLTTHMVYHVPQGMEAAHAINLLNTLDCVEIAFPANMPPPAPVPPDFQTNQGYLNESPVGVDAIQSWAGLGVTGAGIAICDIEYSWNLNHQDLPDVTHIGLAGSDPFDSPDHGTAVLGVLGGVDNGFGVRGIASDAELLVSPAFDGFWRIDDAMLHAIDALDPGDIILIEQQTFGPNFTFNQFGMVPVEWELPIYNTIVTAVGNGIIVIEAAGNGWEDLDDPVYAEDNGGHYPFLPENDSGAIIIGAGHPDGGEDVPRSRLNFSNYGQAVDVQGWGRMVTTCGYGSAYDAEGEDLLYTFTFGGTSSASPIVAGAAALIQSYAMEHLGVTLTPAEMRDILISTGAPQTDGEFPSTQHIGPFPDVIAAIATLGPSNDICSYANVAVAGSQSFSTIGATAVGPDETCAEGLDEFGADVWFEMDDVCETRIAFRLSEVDYDAALLVYDGASCPDGAATPVACATAAEGYLAAVLVEPGDAFRLRIGSLSGEQGSGTLEVLCPGCPQDIGVDYDGVVDVLDLLVLLQSWHTDSAFADINADGLVDVIDLLDLLGAWGSCSD